MKDFFKSVKETFLALPSPLKTLISKRFAVCFGLLAVSIVCFFITDSGIAIPLLVCSAFLLFFASTMLWSCIKGEYVVVHGRCSNYDKTSLRGRLRYLYIYSEDKEKTLKVEAKPGAKNFNLGDRVVIYIPQNAPVTIQDNSYFVSQYYTIALEEKTNADFIEPEEPVLPFKKEKKKIPENKK